MHKPDWETENGAIRLYRADCRDVLPLVEPVATCVTDPPYGLEFMGVAWDTFSDRPKGKARTRNEWGDFGSREHARHPSERAKIMRDKAMSLQAFTDGWASLVLDSLLPGGLLLAFGGTRTYHRMTCAIEDAGFEIRDCLCWLYGQGFPKSLDISKAIDKAAGAEREIIGRRPDWQVSDKWREQEGRTDRPESLLDITTPATDAANLWSGWGTALKPAWEPIILAMKPLDGTFAQNAQKHGVAGLNVDGCRIEGIVPTTGQGTSDHIYGGGKGLRPAELGTQQFIPSPLGRWPANVVLDEEAGRMLDQQSGQSVSRESPADPTPGGKKGNVLQLSQWSAWHSTGAHFGDTGGASRFFYCAKAGEADRRGSKHPTVKPVDLLKWLCKLTMTPTKGTVLDPFMGTGTTLEACYELHRPFIGIEREQSYFDDAVSRAKEIRSRYGLLET